jgi:ATP-dependent RNA helicase DeaD
MKHLIDFIKKIKGQTIVFCSTKYRTRDVAKFLHQEKFDAVAIEGDMSQHRREQSMSKFRSGKADILVATDVASRGIDVPRVELVVNYDVPNVEMAYFHRIGRTARAGAKGRAITLVSYSSLGDWNIIKRQIKVDLKDLNKEMGIEISIPDPLKRQIPSRRYGGPRSRGGYSRDSRPSRFGRSGGSGDARDDRSGGRKRYNDRGYRNSYGGRSKW